MKYVIFDMDGIIFDTERLWQDVTKKANKEFGLSVTEKMRQSFCGRTENDIKQLVRAKYPSLDVDHYRSWQFDYIEKNINIYLPIVKEGFIDLIHFLRQKGVKMGIATGSCERLVKLYFKLIKLDYKKYFDAITTIDDIEIGKPNPMIYSLTCKKLKANPNDCYAIEDSPNGVKSASKAGCKPILVLDLYKINTETKDLCEAIFKNLNEVHTYFQQTF